MVGSGYGQRHLGQLREVAAACEEPSRETLMPEVLLESLHELLRCDSLAFHGVDSRAQQFYDLQELDPEPACGPLGPDEEVSAFWMHERSTTCLHPCVPDDVPSILTTTDVESLRTWRQCTLYNELFKPLGGEYSLILRLPDGPGRTFRLVCWRGPGKCFGEREKSDLLLLWPHLDRAYRRARHSQSVAALTSRHRELLDLVAEGLTNYQIARRLDIAEGTVRAHLNHIYARLGVTSRTAAVTQSSLARTAPAVQSRILGP